MRNLKIIWTLVLATTVGTALAQQQPEPRDATMMSMMKNCPMSVEGTEITATDTADGIALTLTTKPENVNELRDRAQKMLEMHGIPTKSETISNGVRLTLTPKDPAQLAEFRKQVRDHVAHMSKGGVCQQMHEMMQGMKGMMPGMGGAQSTPEPKPETKQGASETDRNAHHPGTKP